MRGRSISGVPVVAALALVACVQGASAPPASAVRARRQPPGPIHHVVLVTLDGMLPESYEHPDAHGLRIPTLRRLVAEGASSDGALSVFPTVTYPSHTSMVTGDNPGRHGIEGNKTFDPLERDYEGWQWYAEDIKVDPVWRIAERAGYAAAIVHWPVSVGAEVTWRVPEYWRAKDAEDAKLERALSTPGLLESVAAEHPGFWSRYPLPSERNDEALTDIATHILATGKPELLLLHLVQIDGAQHDHGVWSPEAIAAIENDDAQLARIFEVLSKSGMSGDTDVIVASDHGFMNVGQLVRPGVLLREAGLVTVDDRNQITDWKASVLVNSAEAYFYTKDPADKATREAVRALLVAKAADPSSGIGRIYDPADIAKAGGDPAAFLAIEATPGSQFGSGCRGSYLGYGNTATHGFDPNRPEMHASLLLAGPNVPHGTLVGARLIDIGPTIASWLGLAMPGVDGAPLKVTPKP